MAEELRGLIEKINEEGIKAAENRAKEIENETRLMAKEIIGKAQTDAKALMDEAREKIAKMEDSMKASLKQAGRDLLIDLRKEINTMLERLVVSHVHKALTPEELVKIITQLIKECSAKEKGDIIVLLKKEDCKKIEEVFLDELRNVAKKGVTLKPSEDIQGGFTISYDSGKSYYDFTDKALAEYLSIYIKPKLAEMLFL